MNKRIRRKLRRGEFAEFGFYFEVLLDPLWKPEDGTYNFESAWDRFVTWVDPWDELFHSKGYCLALGGNIESGRMGGIAEMEHHRRRAKRQLTAADRDEIISLVKSYPGVKAAIFGKINDLWTWTKADNAYYDEFHDEADRALGPMHPEKSS